MTDGLGTDHEKASAIVTNRGGRTCHAAIIARELGIPAVVGCGDATDRIQENQNVTVSCAEGGTGYVYAELLELQRQELQRRRHAGSAAEGDDERRQPGSRVRLRLPAKKASVWRGWNLSSTV